MGSNPCWNSVAITRGKSWTWKSSDANSARDRDGKHRSLEQCYWQGACDIPLMWYTLGPLDLCRFQALTCAYPVQPQHQSGIGMAFHKADEQIKQGSALYGFPLRAIHRCFSHTFVSGNLDRISFPKTVSKFCSIIIILGSYKTIA